MPLMRLCKRAQLSNVSMLMAQLSLRKAFLLVRLLMKGSILRQKTTVKLEKRETRRPKKSIPILWMMTIMNVVKRSNQTTESIGLSLPMTSSQVKSQAMTMVIESQTRLSTTPRRAATSTIQASSYSQRSSFMSRPWIRRTTPFQNRLQAKVLINVQTQTSAWLLNQKAPWLKAQTAT